MGIFINSKVHLPISCEKCSFNYADLSAGICMAADKTIDTRTYGRKRHPDCPLVEIPTPHGRLIDADRLYDIVEQSYRMSNGSRHQCERDFLDLICDSPTILEAEVV